MGIKTSTRKHPEKRESENFRGRFQDTLLYVTISYSLVPDNIQNIEL